MEYRSLLIAAVIGGLSGWGAVALHQAVTKPPVFMPMGYPGPPSDGMGKPDRLYGMGGDGKKWDHDRDRDPGMRPFLMAGNPRFGEMMWLAVVPEDKLDAKLADWQRYREMPDEEKARFRQGIDRFREKMREEALNFAREKQIAFLPGQADQVIRLYWRRRMAIEKDVRQKAEAELQKSMEQLPALIKEDLAKPAPVIQGPDTP